MVEDCSVSAVDRVSVIGHQAEERGVRESSWADPYDSPLLTMETAQLVECSRSGRAVQVDILMPTAPRPSNESYLEQTLGVYTSPSRTTTDRIGKIFVVTDAHTHPDNPVLDEVRRMYRNTSLVRFDDVGAVDDPSPQPSEAPEFHSNFKANRRERVQTETVLRK